MSAEHGYEIEDGAAVNSNQSNALRSIREIEGRLAELKEGCNSVVLNLKLFSLAAIALALSRAYGSHENIQAQTEIAAARAEALDLIQQKTGGNSELASIVTACDKKILRCMGEDFTRRNKDCATAENPIKCIGDAANNFLDDASFERCAIDDNKGKACYEDLSSSVRAMK